MDYTFDRLDLRQFDHAAGKPSRVIHREGAEQWVVPVAPLDPRQPVDWTEYTQGHELMIPLIPYLMRGDLDLAMANMWLLGAYAVQSAIAKYHRPVQRLHLITGYPAEKVSPAPVEGFDLRCWLGVALLLQS